MNKNNLLRVMALIVAVTLFSCLNFTKDKNAFDSDKISGKYKLNLTPLFSNLLENESAISRLALSSLEVNVSFYENNKGVLEMGGKAIDLVSIFRNEPIETVYEFAYKFERDSVFYIKIGDNGEYQERGSVKSLGDNYDYLQFTTTVGEGEKEKNISLNLSKIAE